MASYGNYWLLAFGLPAYLVLVGLNMRLRLQELILA